MSEHEFWNELGNLYFISGAYEPAIHAYARSIELDHGFGRPYSNMALALVHTGKYLDAIELYHRSIELLTDPKEKAITWNRLGILYRQIKDYHSALVAYEQADKLDTHQDEKREEASRNVKYPLAVSMPEIDLKAILAKPEEAAHEDEQLAQTLNEKMEVAEAKVQIDWFDGDFVSPDPIEGPANEFVDEEDALVQDLSISMEEEGWIPIVFEEAIPVGIPFKALEPMREEPINVTTAFQVMSEDIKLEKEESIEEPVKEVEGKEIEDSSENKWAEVSSYQINNGLLVHPDELPTEALGEETEENQWAELSGSQVEEAATHSEENQTEVQESEPAFENLSTTTIEYNMDEDAPVAETQNDQPGSGDEISFETESINTTEVKPIEYSLVEYPLVELSPAEIDSIYIDIARFKRIIHINPRNAFAYDTLGGLYKALGQFKDAITSYQQAIALDSTKPSYFYQLGLMYSAEEREQDAIGAFKQVISMDPKHILANASLGNMYRKKGLDDIAQTHIDIALQNIYEEENEYNQACIEAICGHTDRALELLEIAIEDNPSYINWAQHDPDLDMLHHDERFQTLIQTFAQNK